MGTITDDAEGAYSPLLPSPPTIRTQGGGSSRHSGSASPSPRRLRSSLASTWLRWSVGVAALLLLLLFMYAPDQYAGWRKQGCPTKIFRLTATMRDALEAAKDAGLDPELGQPVNRRPRTAIVNFVSFHVEVVSALAYHFVRLHHNVSVYSREDWGMEEVAAPYYNKKWKRFESFFKQFHEFDVVVLATFPTCHLETFRELLSFKLPQRYFVTVHNPALLNDTGAAEAIAIGDVRVLTIAPHVGAYAAEMLDLHGVHPHMEWLAPIMPVLYPEDCGSEQWTWEAPACYEGDDWRGKTPGEVVAAGEGQRGRRRPGGKGQPATGLCIQGKLDPTRRNYYGIFQEMLASSAALRAANFSLTLVGRGSLEVPPQLEEAGLVRQFTSLPFQEYYEVLHGCAALMPAFSSPAYYANKGSSSVGTSLVTGAPLVATPALLRAYSFLDESAVVLVKEGASELEAMLAVLRLDRSVLEAKRLGLSALWMQLFERNMVTLQKLLGARYLYRNLAWRPPTTLTYRSVRHYDWLTEMRKLRRSRGREEAPDEEEE